MNQILSFESDFNKKKNKKPKNSKGPVDIKKIIIFFAILLVVFGICIIVKAIYDVSNEEDTSDLSKPTITIEENTETGMLDITIKHDRAIDKIIYSWNGKNQVEIDGKNRNYINESIEIPEGTNTLKLQVIDVKNVTTSYEKDYTGKITAQIDIEITQGESSVKLVATSDDTISYITYKWNDETEKEIEVNDTSYETSLQVPEGENVLTVVAVDEDGNETEKSITVQGIIDEKPTLNVSIDEEGFIITAYDDEGIEKVILRINGEDTTIEVGEQNFEYKIPFIDGNNEIRIKVYNINGLTASQKAILTK